MRYFMSPVQGVILGLSLLLTNPICQLRSSGCLITLVMDHVAVCQTTPIKPAVKGRFRRNISGTVLWTNSWKQGGGRYIGSH